MKSKLFSIIVFFYCLISVNTSFAQPRDAGQIVVPKGWEDQDSIRWGLFDIDFGYGHSSIDSMADSLEFTFQHAWGMIPASRAVTGKRKGIMAWPVIECARYSPFDIGSYLKQRIYFAAPKPFDFRFEKGYWWRYCDTMSNPNAKFYYNPYDSNDISPFMEFPARVDYLTADYTTKRYKPSTDEIVDSTFKYGNYGKLILGFSDNRKADQILRTIDRYPIPDTWRTALWRKYKYNDWSCFNYTQIYNPDNVPLDTLLHRVQVASKVTYHLDSALVMSGPSPDTAKTFSAIVEFNVDTTSILDTLWSGASDDIPLFRLQILFKKGNDSNGSGWNPLPFVPFRTSSTITDNRFGWYALIDTIITRKLYRQLDHSWRKRDSLEVGGYAQNWRFKQIHVTIDPTNIPQNMKDLLQAYPSVESKGPYGEGSGKAGINVIQGQDTLVGFGRNIDSKDTSFIETRILSTYRAPVRVRSLVWQDEIVDKFLYRRRDTTTDESYSCKPDGSPSYKDDSVQAVFAQWASDLGPRRPRELMFNDKPPEVTGLASSAMAYVDYMGSKVNVHTHGREQEFGNWSSHMRRERLSYDGKPMSMYQNQVNVFFSDRLWDGYLDGDDAQVRDIFPSDYIANAWSFPSDTAWLSSRKDSVLGIIMGRTDTVSGDNLRAYKQYTNVNAGVRNYLSDLRQSVYVAHKHPKHKRYAVEADVQGWGQLWHTSDRKKDGPWSPHYGTRPTTPEENTGMIFGALANGVTAFSSAQCIDFADSGGAAPGAFHVKPRANGSEPRAIASDYNFGNHIHGSPWNWWDTTTESCFTDGIDYEYYMGYSNTFRSFKRAFSSINRVYDTNAYNKKYPFKRLEWLDAYSSQKALSTGTSSFSKDDSSTYTNTFLKAYCSTPVKRWSRGAKNEYIDSLVADSAHRTYAEVGLFRDNPNDTLKGYAAMVVNTRLWPSLRDAEDSIYYNQGLDSAKDRSRSTLGDIDTRKVWFKIDTSNFPPEFQTQYYTIRDVWHQDTTYLVKHDSNFAIYLKPGEARLLYIEKGIAIKAAKTAEATAFSFNNGRRIVERDSIPKDVITYIRNGDLYVSYPARGKTFEGYNERSEGDNIATGYEVKIDTGNLFTPSISVAPKNGSIYDGGIAIAYFKKDSGNYGRIHFAFQQHPDSLWNIVAYQGSRFADLSGDGSDVTPVLTPYNSNTWIVAASYMGTPVGLPGNPGILGFRMNITSAGVPQVVDLSPHYLYTDNLVDVGNQRSTFPTLGSRPLADSLYPVRMAWQKGGQIYYRRIKSGSPSTLILDASKVISKGLPSICYNMHPSIATGGFSERYYSQTLTPTALSYSIPYISDNVVWESKLFAPSSKGEFWTVLRPSSQRMDVIPVNWGQFVIMRPDTSATGYRYPVVTSEHKTHDIFRKRIYNIPQPTQPYVTEGLRVGWHDDNLGKLEFGHLLRYFYKTELQDPGIFPSLPITTGDLMPSQSDPFILKSLSYLDTTNTASKRNVQVTNGWFPFVAKPKSIQSQWSFVIYKDPVFAYQCPEIAIKDGKGPQIKQYIPSNDSSIFIDWLNPPPGDYGDFGENWSVPEVKPLAVSTEYFVAHPNDSLIIPRWIDTIDVSSVQSILQNSSDYLIYRIRMYRASDSVYLMTLDSGAVTKTSVLMPGSGLDANAVRVKLSGSFSVDTVFLSHQFLRTDSTNTLARLYISDYVDSETDGVVYKRSADTPTPSSIEHSRLKVDIFPNPLSLTATVEVGTPDDIQTLIELFDINGKKVITLFDGSSSGKLTLTLDGKDLINGIYFLRTQCGNSVVTKKIELIK